MIEGSEGRRGTKKEGEGARKVPEKFDERGRVKVRVKKVCRERVEGGEGR